MAVATLPLHHSSMDHSFDDPSFLNIKMITPLGDNAFFIERLYVKEGLNTLSSMRIECHSRYDSFQAKDLLGKQCRIEIGYAPFSTTLHDNLFEASSHTMHSVDETHHRYFSGIIGNIEQGFTDDALERTHYTFYIYPPLWLLQFNQDYRIFQNTSPKDICAALFHEHNLVNVGFQNTTHGNTIRKYCVQYGESALDFTTRLLSEEGLFFITTSSTTGEQLTIYDDIAHLPTLDESSIPYHTQTVASCFHGTIQSFSKKITIIPHKAALADYNFISPHTKLFPKTEGQGEGGLVYQYPGRFFSLKTGEDMNKMHMERLENYREVCHGHGTALSMHAGGKFKLTHHPKDELNAEYVIHEVEHEFYRTSPSNDGKTVHTARPFYRNHFTCVPSSQPYRPLLKTKPRIHSNQMALVVGPPGEDIHTDEFGRIKVQFYWDQRGDNNDKSSCWLRVAQGWSGPHFGVMFIPRINTEVIVSFFEGDPDRPIVIGCAYNGDTRPPYPLPLEKTKSVIRSRSVKTLLERYNEISFEDRFHEEELYVRSQKNYRHDVMDGDGTVTVHKGDFLIEHLGKEEKTQTHRLHLVRGTHSIDLDEGDQIITLKKGNQTIVLHQGDATTTLKKGNITLKLQEGDTAVTLQKGSMNMNLENGNLDAKITGKLDAAATKDMTLKTDATFTCDAAKVKFNASGGIEIETGGSLSIKAGGSIDIKGSTITLNGSMVTIGGGLIKIG